MLGALCILFPLILRKAWTPLAERKSGLGRLNNLIKVTQHWSPRRLMSLPETHSGDPVWGDLAKIGSPLCPSVSS